MTLKVALINPRASGDSGDCSLLDIAQGLAARGHEVVTLATAGNPFLGAAARAGLPTEVIPDGLDYPAELDVDLPLHTRLPPWSALKSLRRILTSHRIRIAVVDHDTPRLPLRTAGLGLGIEIVHVFDPHLPLPTSTPTRAHRLTPGGHWVIHAPESLGALLAHHGPRVDPEAVVLIPHPIDREALAAIDRRMARRTVRRDLGCRESDPLVVAVGSPAPHVKVVHDALALLGETAPRTLWIGGDPEPAADGVEKAAPGVPLTFVRDAPFAHFLAAADAAVITSSRDHLPLALPTAMSLEVPVIATGMDDHRSLLGIEDPSHPPAANPWVGGLAFPAPRGLLVPAFDPQALATALDQVFGNPEAARSRAAAAQLYVNERHNLRRVISAWEGWLGSLLATGNGK